MNKEELEKEAEEWAKDHHYYNVTVKGYVAERDSVINAYLASAEPREKQIQIDAERIITLQKQNGELTDKVKELEAQIEKMRCCPNCDFMFRDGNCYYDKECKNKDHWKLRR